MKIFEVCGLGPAQFLDWNGVQHFNGDRIKFDPNAAQPGDAAKLEGYPHSLVTRGLARLVSDDEATQPEHEEND